MLESHFRSCNRKKIELFPQTLDEKIEKNSPVRLVDALIDSLDLSKIINLYKEKGRSPYDPVMLLKVIVYAYMNNVYSCRRIENLLDRDIHFIWLAGGERPDFITINRFRNRIKAEINDIFTQIVLAFATRGLIRLEVEYIDGTKIESKANKYTFVWRKSVLRHKANLLQKIRALCEQIDDVSLCEQSNEGKESIEITSSLLTEMASALRESLANTLTPTSQEEKATLKKKQKQLNELEADRDKLQEYEVKLAIAQARNSYSKTDHDATFMRLKDDVLQNGQTKPAYNLQIGTENQFITDFALFPNPTDTLTLIPFLDSFKERYGRFPHVAVADAGYGSEENYRFMNEHDIESYVKYNYFHMEERPKFTPKPSQSDYFFYNADEDFCVCPMGQKMRRVGTKIDYTESGYETESALYRATQCKGCSMRAACFKGEGNRTIQRNHRLQKLKTEARERLSSEEGIKHRKRRNVEPEAVFGQMKSNMGYKRFRHFGLDKVFMDLAFFAIGFNIKKLHKILLKEGVKGFFNLFNTAIFLFFTFFWRYNLRKSEKMQLFIELRFFCP